MQLVCTGRDRIRRKIQLLILTLVLTCPVILKKIVRLYTRLIHVSKHATNCNFARLFRDIRIFERLPSGARKRNKKRERETFAEEGKERYIKWVTKYSLNMQQLNQRERDRIRDEDRDKERGRA